MAESVSHVNKRVAGYRFITRIAKGSTGTVWKAVSRDQKETVAVKLLNPELLADSSARTAFAREYTICRNFDCPGLLSYMDSGVLGKTPYLMMNYFASRTLKACLMGSRDIPIFQKARTIIKSVAGALNYLHDRGVIHRDIKPENILVNQDGGTKLIDFSISVSGLSKWLKFLRKSAGTPSYMAPEAIRNEKISPQTDIYSFGATIFEQLTGRPPFIGESQDEILQMHISALPPTMSHYNRNISPDMDKLIGQMLKKSSADRLPDMQSFITRLNRIKIFIDES